MPNPDLRVLFFDLYGTVFHERDALEEYASAILASCDLGRQLCKLWLEKRQELIDMIIRRAAPWSSNEVISRAALRYAIERTAPTGLSNGAFELLLRRARELPAWPDSRLALARLSTKFVIATLSNATREEIVHLSTLNSIQWSTIISAEMAQTFKPDPAVYELALEKMNVAPNNAMMVAAHPTDLAAASRAGIRTAFVDRPTEPSTNDHDRFELSVSSLAELAEILVDRYFTGGQRNPGTW